MIEPVLTNVRGQNTSQVTWNIHILVVVVVVVVDLLMMVRERLRQMVRRQTTLPV